MPKAKQATPQPQQATARKANVRSDQTTPVEAPSPALVSAAAAPDTVIPAPRRTKAALIRDLLARPDGATTASLMEATGWQAHTVRAALSGLRKSGVEITRAKIGDETLYRATVTLSESRT